MSEDEARGLARAYVDSGQDIYEFCKGLEPAQVAAVRQVIGSMSDMDWREMNEGNRLRHQLAVGDSITVPTLVFS